MTMATIDKTASSFLVCDTEHSEWAGNFSILSFVLMTDGSAALR